MGKGLSKDMDRLQNSSISRLLWVFHLSQYLMCLIFTNDQANKEHFTKTRACKICSIQGNRYSCDTGKYNAFISKGSFISMWIIYHIFIVTNLFVSRHSKERLVCLL